MGAQPGLPTAIEVRGRSRSAKAWVWGQVTNIGFIGNGNIGSTLARLAVNSIGYNAYDVGPLSEGWRYQRDTAAYVQPYAISGSDYPTWPGQQVTLAMLKEKLDAAVRYREM